MGALVLIALIALVLLGICAAFEKMLNRHFERGQQAQWETDRRRLQDYAVWFSEDAPTQKLIRDLAEKTDAGRIRDDWRKARLNNQAHRSTPESDVERKETNE